MTALARRRHSPAGVWGTEETPVDDEEALTAAEDATKDDDDDDVMNISTFSPDRAKSSGP